MRKLIVFCAALVALGCTSPSGEEVVVYTALDEEFSRPIFEAFTRETGIAVRAKYDVESTKSVGLTQAILAERDRPRCDVFWNNEVVNTLRLARAGVLAPYESPAGAAFPPQVRSSRGTWHGFAARARVLVVNTELVNESDRPTSVHDLTDPRWKGRVGIAKPLAGTTATHAACLFAAWGEERAQEFLRAVRANARVMGGNKQVARAVADGELAFGLTDTDDAIIEIESGRPVVIVFPDQHSNSLPLVEREQERNSPSLPLVGRAGEGGEARAEHPERVLGDAAADHPSLTLPIKGREQEGGHIVGREPEEGRIKGREQEEGRSQRREPEVTPLGTLMIPNTVAIIDGAAHRAAAERLVDYLLSSAVEQRLAEGPSAQFPLNPNVDVKSRAAPAEAIRPMEVDFEQAAEQWDAAAQFLRDEFTTAE